MFTDKETLSAKDLAENRVLFALGSWCDDIRFLPAAASVEELSSTVATLARSTAWPQALEPLRASALTSPLIVWGVIVCRYLDEVEALDEEPAWAGALPLALRGDLLRSACLSGSDAMHLSPGFHYTSLRYLIRHDGMLDTLTRSLKLQRLYDISQLGFIHQPAAAGIGKSDPGLGQRFAHNRFAHSVDVAVLTALMVHNNRRVIPESDARHAVAAAFLHDALTPAGGDTTKLLNPQAFDEDLNFQNLLSGDGWRQVSAAYGLDRNLLTSIVQETQVLGHVKDIGDKIAYVCRDAWQLVSATRFHYGDGRDDIYEDVERLTSAHPLIGDLWEDVRVADGRAFFTRPQRLYVFLKLRALMFRNLYHNPETRSPQFVVAEAMMRRMYKAGELTVEDLLTISDHELIARITKWLGVSWHELQVSGVGRIVTETHPTLPVAYRRAKELQDAGILFTCVEDMRNGAKSATRLLVQAASGAVEPFSQVLPAETAEIERICQDVRTIRLYALYDPVPALRDRLRS